MLAFLANPIVQPEKMAQDLFLTKEQILERWCKEKGFFSKADLMDYGLRNYYLRADRTVRSWVVEGRVRRLSRDECLFRGLKGKMAWYSWGENKNEKKNDRP